MSILNLLIASFIISAAFCFNRNKLLLSLALPILLVAPIAFCLAAGSDGLVYSLAGMGAALLLTLPLKMFRVISGSELIISIALGGALGASQYAVAFCIATAFLSVQRFLKVESAPRLGALAGSPAGYGSGLLAADEKSALVEIEALKILHRDRKDISDEEFALGREPQGEAAHGFGRAQFLPWCAKLALATLTVLMLGSSI